MKRVDLNQLLIGSGLISTTFLILFQKVSSWDLPLWLIWNLIISSVIYQIGLIINKEVNPELEVKVYYWIQILAIPLSAYYTILHHSPAAEFRLILYNYFIYLISYCILTICGFIIVALYGLAYKPPFKNFKEGGRIIESMNETQLRAILHEALKNENYSEAEKIQKILDKKFP